MQSAATLYRLARSEKNPAKKAKLKKSAANARRRERRKARNPHPAVQQRVDRVMNELNQIAAQQNEQPGRGEIVGAQNGEAGKQPVHAATDHRIPLVIKDARSKDKDVSPEMMVGIHLRSVYFDGVSQGRREAEPAVKRSIEMSKRSMRKQLVREFLATVVEFSKIGGLPTLSLVNRSTIEALVEELKEHGWAPENR